VIDYDAEQGWDPTTGAPLLEALEIADYAEPSMRLESCWPDPIEGASRQRYVAPRWRSVTPRLQQPSYALSDEQVVLGDDDADGHAAQP
jgi:hypothetical protein